MRRGRGGGREERGRKGSDGVGRRESEGWNEVGL